MRNSKLSILSTLLAAFFCSGLVVGNANVATAQSQGINGFDWIGTDPLNVDAQRCYASVQYSGGAYYYTSTAWTPPASQNPKYIWKYDMQTFRAQVGAANVNAQPGPHPSTFAGWKLEVYDSFASFQQNPGIAFRARYTFNINSPAIVYQNSLNCHAWTIGQTFPIPCYRLTLDLSQPSSVEYKTANGQTTTAPLQLNGGTRYWFSLVGLEQVSTTASTCVVRTNPNLGQTASPIPSPPVSFPMSAAQCAEAGFPPNCFFPLAHSDFQKAIVGLCNPNRSAVNYLAGYSQFGPFLNPDPNGAMPLTCGGANQTACCERTQSAHWAKALTVNRIVQTVVSVGGYGHPVVPAAPCVYPTC